VVMSGGGNGEKMVVEIEWQESEALGVISASFLESDFGYGVFSFCIIDSRLLFSFTLFF